MALRVALGLVVLVAGLGLVLGSSAGVGAEGPEALELTLTAGRPECTAGTLNPVTWEIRDGVGPYRLTADGASVDADAESATATCGALPEGATEAPGTITAVVTDATGATATASAAYTIVPPLPAPANFRVGVHPGFVYSYWDTVRGAGSQFPEFDESQLSPAERDKRGLDGYLVRYRTDAASTWTYAEHSDGEWTTLAGYLRPWDTPPPGTFYTASVAAARHPLELETPEALNWGAPIRYTTSGPAQNLTVRATHNTVTVSWSKQPGTDQAYIYLDNLRGGGAKRYVAEGNEPGTHTVTLNHLEPNSEYTIWIRRDIREGRGAVSHSFRTESAPPGWQPLPRGPQNLMATATHDTITVTWDPPFEGASPEWSAAMLDGEILVHIFKTNDGTTTWVISGEVDSIGRYRIRPDTTYTIIVRHKGVRRMEQTITVTTQAAPPLQLSLTAGRSECTAGTLNPVSWTIRGGVGPYRLTVDGASVDADAESATVTCGDLPDYGIWLPVTQAPGTITAVVTDATGATATASAAYTIVPPLPAPANVSAQGLRTLAEARWDASPAASGSVHYILRWKKTADVDWTYEHEFLEYKHQGTKWLWSAEGLAEGTPYEVAVAVMRDPIERQTPDALRWSPRLSFATATDPQNVVVTSTHDTITVTWDVGAGDRLSQVWVDSGEGTKDPKTKTIANGQVRAVFTSLLPDTDYTVRIRTLQAPLPNQPTGATVSIRTKTAPSDWTPLPTGPKNLRVSATHNTITATWDAPHADANPSYGIDLKDVETGRPVPPWITIDETTFTLENLQPARSYELQVTHYGATTASETRTVTTGAAPTSALTCFEYLVGAVICTR